jgi:hypothetical protein
MRGFKADPQRCLTELREAFRRGGTGETGGIRDTDLSLRRLAEECLGYQAVNDLFDPRQPISPRQLREAESAVDSTGFSNITGQLIINRVMQSFQAEEFVASQKVTTIPTRLDGEKIPGISGITDPNNNNIDNLTVKEGMPYPHADFSEDYIDTPSTEKRGLIVSVTREAIFFDRTGLVAGQAAKVGEVLGLNKEKRLLDAIAGLVNLYSWKGTTYQTYYQAIDSANWVNHLDGNQLQDWTDVDNCETLFGNLLDPNTGEPVVAGGGGMTLFVPWPLRSTAVRIVGATSIDTHTASSTIVTYGTNPLTGLGVQVLASRLLYRRIINAGIAAANAAGWWFYGDLGKAFAYMENWPITVTQSGMDSEVGFNQDIVLRYKASERGAAAVLEPRAMVRCRTVSTSSSSGT